MTKAALMNSARYMTGTNANDNLWSNAQGMGEVNLTTAFGLFSAPSVLRDQVFVWHVDFGSEHDVGLQDSNGTSLTFTGNGIVC